MHPSKYTTYMLNCVSVTQTKRCEMIGKHFIESFKKTIETVMLGGNENKGKKLSVARM